MKKAILELSQFLAKIDRNHTLSDYQDKYHHHVSYRNSRTILRYVEKDVILTAYAYNPGNGLVIFPKKGGLIAYGCYLTGFPVADGYSNFHWTKLAVDDAIAIIKRQSWEFSCYDQHVEYIEAPFKQWDLIAKGRIDYTTYADRELTLAEFYSRYSDHVYYCDFEIYRLSSGRLRVEVDGKYISALEFITAYQFLRKPDFSEQTITGQLPRINSWQKVLVVSEINPQLEKELEVQAIAGKMKEAS
jgi:hypothetical protein